MQNHNLSFLQKRYNLLLEVLIALAIVAVIAVPLVYPHVVLLREQQRFIKSTELDHVVNLFYADLVASLYNQEIPWNDMAQGHIAEIPDTTLRTLNGGKEVPYRGFYGIHIGYTKPKKPTDITYHLIELELVFIPKSLPETASEQEMKEKAISYFYQIYAERNYDKDEHAIED